MKNYFAFIMLFIAASMGAGSIGINSLNSSGAVGIHHVRTGVPFAKGRFRNADNFAVFYDGKQLPAQFEVLSRYPDGSARWVSADFMAPFNGSKEQKFTLKTDGKSKCDGKISVKKSDSDFTVDTGKVRFTVGRKKFFFGKENSKSIKLYFRDGSGKLFAAENGTLDSAEITSSGTIRTSLRLEGWFGSEDKIKSCRYILYLDFYSGSSTVQSNFSFIITEEKDKARFSEITLAVPGKYSTGQIGGVKGDAFNKYLLQYAYDKYLVSDINNPRAYCEKGDGKFAPGWVKAGKTAVFIEDFKENFPSEISLSANDICCHIWPAHGVAKPDRKVTSADRQYLWFCHENKILNFDPPADYLQGGGNGKHYLAEAKEESCLGLSKTMYCRIDFDADSEPSGFFIDPPAALPDKEAVSASKVFGPMKVYDKKSNPAEEEMIERRSRLERHLAETTGPGDFGKWNYGDGHSIWRVADNRWDDSWRTWKGYHHASGSVPWILALRKTGWEEYKRAIAVSRHLSDIDICHYETEQSVERSRKKYAVSGKIKGGLNDYKGLTHWHAGDRLFDYNAQTEYALTWWYITGSRRGLETAKMWGDAVVKHFKRTWDRREGTGTSAALIDLYYAIPDKRYLETAEKFIAHVLRTQTPPNVLPSGHLQSGSMVGWANYAPGLRKYYELTGDKNVERAICRWADAFMNGYGDTTSIGAKLHDCIDVMAYAWKITGDKKYLEYGRWLLDNYMYLYSFDDMSKCKPVESVEYFMTERIPIFLAAQEKYGRKITPRPLEKGLPEFSYRSTGKPKNGDHTIYLLGDGKPFTVDIGVISSNKYPISVTLETNDGKIICDKKLKVDKTKQGNCSITVDPAPAGVYVLKARKQLVSLRLRCRLKQTAPAGTIYSCSGGGSFAFEIEENGTLEWKCRPSIAVYPVFAALISPENKCTHWRFYAPRDGKEKRFRQKVKPGVWKLSGIFAPMPSNLKINRKPIKYLSPSAEKYFNPDKVKSADQTGAKAVFKVL